MEQTTQQTIQKPPLPIKTKIVPLFILIFIFIIFSYLKSPGIFALASYIAFPFAISLLLTRRKWAKWAWEFLWEFLFIILFVATILTLPYYLNKVYSYYKRPQTFDIFFFFITPLIFPIIPLILLNLDKRNYFELIKKEIPTILATKTVALIIICLGGWEIFIGLGTFVIFPLTIIGTAPMILFGFLSFISALFLFRRKKFGWWLAILTLFIIFYLILSPKPPIPILEPTIPPPIFFERIFNFLPFVVCFVLLLLDRKNFWKIAA